jgi:hypothetical protein
MEENFRKPTYKILNYCDSSLQQYNLLYLPCVMLLVCVLTMYRNVFQYK